MLEKVFPKSAYPLGAGDNMSLNYRLNSRRDTSRQDSDVNIRNPDSACPPQL